VTEVNRPDRTTRHRLGKSDPIDAEMAARGVLSGVASGIPKVGDGRVEMVRMLKIATDPGVKARTKSLNQIQALLVTAPAELRGPRRPARCPAAEAVRRIPRRGTDRPGIGREVRAAAPGAPESRAARRGPGPDRQITALAAAAATALMAVFGIGPDGAARFLITAWDNPGRLQSEAAFAALCGTNPVPASSGKTQRHRLSRGGDRQANAPLHRAAVVRLRWQEPSRACTTRRLADGKAQAEVISCLKRYIACGIYHALCPPPAQASPAAA
jgi:transposase